MLFCLTIFFVRKFVEGSLTHYLVESVLSTLKVDQLLCETVSLERNLTRKDEVNQNQDRLSRKSVNHFVNSSERKGKHLTEKHQHTHTREFAAD